MGLLFRELGPGDHPACRGLWVELTEQHRRLYDDPSIGGDDPGEGFDAYLARSDRVGSWVAVAGTDVVGLTGLLDHGTSAEVEPVVVTVAHRHQGVGRALIERAVAEAAARGFEYLAVRPVARNEGAIRSFYGAGFRTLGGHVDLTMDLTERRHRWLDGPTLFGLDFRH